MKKQKIWDKIAEKVTFSYYKYAPESLTAYVNGKEQNWIITDDNRSALFLLLKSPNRTDETILKIKQIIKRSLRDNSIFCKSQEQSYFFCKRKDGNWYEVIAIHNPIYIDGKLRIYKELKKSLTIETTKGNVSYGAKSEVERKVVADEITGVIIGNQFKLKLFKGI